MNIYTLLFHVFAASLIPPMISSKFSNPLFVSITRTTVALQSLLLHRIYVFILSSSSLSAHVYGNVPQSGHGFNLICLIFRSLT